MGSALASHGASGPHDATRIVPYAAFALSESTAAFLPVLRQAVLRRGVPTRLYVDNGAVYRSHHLSLVCAKLVSAAQKVFGHVDKAEPNGLVQHQAATASLLPRSAPPEFAKQ